MKALRLCTAFALVVFSAFISHARPPSTDNTLYDSDPKHLWNRLHETLFARTASDNKTYGLDELDLLYWRTTKHLLEGPSHPKALAILDEFIDSHGEKLIQDPLKRALLQRDLWALFDWSAEAFSLRSNQPERRELQRHLALAIRRLALTKSEIDSLPNNYTQADVKALPDFPRGLFDTNSPWVNVGINGDAMAGEAHVRAFEGHSAFFVMLRHPAGRESAISYLDSLRKFERVWTYQTNRFQWASTNEPNLVMQLNPDLPQFPTNTEWTLIRQMCVIDTAGRIQPTHITESIQLRRYAEIKPMHEFSTNAQQFFEFEMDRRKNAALRAIGKDEKGFVFVHFMGKGIDPFESAMRNRVNATKPFDSESFQHRQLQTCMQCHSQRGIFSVNSYTRFLTPSSEKPAAIAHFDTERESTQAIHWKQRQFDWGLLQGLWDNQR